MRLPTAYKSILSNDSRVTPYNPYSSVVYTYVSGSTSNSSDLTISKGIQYTGSSILRDPSTNYELYSSVSHIFYSSASYATYGLTYDTYTPSGSLYVISIVKDAFGDTIVPSTFKLTINGISSYDDGRGNLYVSSSGTGYKIGNIFYNNGVVVVQENSAGSTSIGRQGLCIVNDSVPITTEFSSSITLYENTLRVEISPGEFNISPYNPTTYSSSFFYPQSPQSMSSAIMLEYMVSRSMGITEPSCSMVPYITSIGFYNIDNELLAIAKLSTPVKRTLESTQTFIVKFDI